MIPQGDFKSARFLPYEVKVYTFPKPGAILTRAFVASEHLMGHFCSQQARVVSSARHTCVNSNSTICIFLAFGFQSCQATFSDDRKGKRSGTAFHARRLIRMHAQGVNVSPLGRHLFKGKPRRDTDSTSILIVLLSAWRGFLWSDFIFNCNCPRFAGGAPDLLTSSHHAPAASPVLRLQVTGPYRGSC